MNQPPSVMNNPLSSTLNADNLLQKIVSDIKACISEMKQEFEEYGFGPLTDDSSSLNKFCAKLELLLQFGMKERTGLFGGAKGYWNYMQDSLSNNKNLKDGLRFVKARSELKTNTGRGRALIRFSLVHHRLADTLQYCLMNARLNSEWYSVKSLFNQKNLAGDLLVALYDLNDVQFDLDPRDAELDTCWPTFARKAPGVVFNWRPPSRTGSIASLSSIPNLEIYPSTSFSMASNIEAGNAFITDRMSFDPSEMLMEEEGSTSEEDVEHLRKLVEDITAKYDAASKRIEELEVELEAKESYIRENEIGMKKTVLDVVQPTKEEEGLSNETFKESSAEDGNLSSQIESSVKVQSFEGDNSAVLHSSVEVEGSRLSSRVRSEEKNVSLVEGGNRDDAYLSTITSLQQQLMTAVNAREHLVEEISLARAEIERLTNVEVKSQLLQREKSRLVEEVEALNKDLRDAKEERNHVELRSREENFFETAFGDAMKDKALAEESLDQLKSDYSQLSAKFETLEDRKQEMEERLERTLVERQNLAERVVGLEKTGEEQKEDISRLQLEFAEAQKRIAELELGLTAGRDTTQELERKYKEASDEISKGNNESERILREKEKLCETLEREKSEMSEELRKAVEKNEEFDREGDQLKSRVSELEEQLESSRLSQKESTSKARLLEESVEKTQAELHEVFEKKEALESEKESLVEKLREKSENLAQKLTEYENLSDKLREMEEKSASEEESFKALIAERDKVIADLQEDLDALSGSVQRREKMWENAREGMEGDISEKATRIQALEQLVADGFTKQRIIELERQTEELKDSVGAIQLELEIDQDRARVQLDDLKQCLGHLEHEKFQLHDQLKERDGQMDMEREAFVKSKQKWEEESRTMNDDLTALKKRVIKLVREKADLWQKTDDLTYGQRVKASYQWMDSTDVTNCLICHNLFSVTLRKHHCRKCGRVLCYNCCNHWVLLPHSKIKERICNECQMDMSLLLETTINSTTDGESDTESCSEEPASAGNRESMDSREPASDNNRESMDSREPASDNNRKPVDSREPTSANGREPEPVSGRHFLSSATGETASLAREYCESINATKSLPFYGDGNVEAGSPLSDQSFEEKGIEPAEEDANSKELVQHVHSSDALFGAGPAEEVLSKSNSENGELLVATENGSESLGKVLDSGGLDDNVRTAAIGDTASGNVAHDTSAAWSLSGSAKVAASWVSSAASVTTSLASSLLPKQRKSLHMEECLGDAPGINREPDALSLGVESERVGELDVQKREEADDDVFDLISPEEISESRLWPTPDPNLLCGTVVKLCDAEVEGVVTVSENELTIKAGKCFAIPVSIEVVGLKLSWQFSTYPKGISFSVLYKESDAIPREECVSLIPITRLNSHQQTVTGELKAKKLGVYTLLFDNLASRFTAKKLKYRLQAEMTELTLPDVEDVK